MASQAEIEALAITNRQVIQDIQSNTISAAALNSTQKRVLIENIFPSGVAININDPNIKNGDHVFGEKAGINNGSWFFGEVLTTPPTQDSHITFKIVT